MKLLPCSTKLLGHLVTALVILAEMLFLNPLLQSPLQLAEIGLIDTCRAHMLSRHTGLPSALYKLDKVLSRKCPVCKASRIRRWVLRKGMKLEVR